MIVSAPAPPEAPIDGAPAARAFDSGSRESSAPRFPASIFLFSCMSVSVSMSVSMSMSMSGCALVRDCDRVTRRSNALVPLREAPRADGDRLFRFLAVRPGDDVPLPVRGAFGAGVPYASSVVDDGGPTAESAGVPNHGPGPVFLISERETKPLWSGVDAAYKARPRSPSGTGFDSESRLPPPPRWR